jgi:hypothetical protein
MIPKSSAILRSFSALIIAVVAATWDGATGQLLERNQGGLINTTDIRQMCASAPVLTYRKTVIYVDLAEVQKLALNSKGAKPEWGLTILNKLELAPREALTVLSVDPSTFDVKQVFESCLPILTDSEITDARKTRTIFQKLTSMDPGDQNRENLQTFNVSLGNALDRILRDSSSFSEGTRRDILGAIALDKDRYSDKNAFYRVIIYTDGVIKEPSLERGQGGDGDLSQNLAERFQASYSGAEVMVFGIDGNFQEGTLQGREDFFSDYFLRSWAHMKSFSPSLPRQEDELYSKASRMDGGFEGCGSKGSAKLALFSAERSETTNGWLAFNMGPRMLYVPLEGVYRCTGGSCGLKAECNQSVPPQSKTPYVRKGDKIVLSGKSGERLDGSLEPPIPESCIGGPQESKEDVKYDLHFSF